MKRIFIATTILAAFAGGAALANERSNERPDNVISSTKAAELREVVAQSIYSNEDLSRWNLSGDETVQVTVFPSTGLVDRKTRND
jgi:hypothetical protein